MKAIRQKKFLTILRNLKMKLNFFEYYRFFVNYFVNIVKPLVQLKTRNFIDAFIKNRRKKNYFNKIYLKQRGQNRSRNISLLLSNINNINLLTKSNCVKV